MDNSNSVVTCVTSATVNDLYFVGDPEFKKINKLLDREVILYRGFVIGGLLAVVLSACAVVDPVHPRSDTIDRSLERTRNESILLNIVRASHQWPLNFTAIAQVSPSAMNQTTLGLPNFLTGPNPVPLPPGRE